MHIDPKKTIGGWPTMDVRSLVRTFRRDLVTVDAVREKLSPTREEIWALLLELEQMGILQRSITRGSWIVTVKGNAFAAASAAPSISRAVADKALESFLERVHKVNSSAYYLFRVSKVAIFGSYITNAMKLNDVDIAYELVPAIDDPDKSRDASDQRTAEAKKKGRRFRTVAEELYWAQSEVILFLQARSRIVNLHTFFEIEALKCDFKMVYELFQSRLGK